MQKGNQVSAFRSVIYEGQVAWSGKNNNAIGKVMDMNTPYDMKEERRVKVANDSRTGKRNQKSDRNREEDV